MAYSFIQLREEARRWLDAYNDPAWDLTFPGFVRQAEERIYTASRIQPYRQVANDALAAGDNTFILPDNYTGMISLAVVGYGSNLDRTNLLQKNFDWLTEAIPTGAPGRPLFYAIQSGDGGNVQDCTVAPIPASACNLYFEYYGKPTSLVDVPANTTTWVSRNAETTLLQGVLYYAYLYEKGEDDMTAKYLAEFDKGLLLLLNTARGLMRRDDFKSSPQAMKE